MFAVIKTGGKQYRVQVGDILNVEKLDLGEGKKVTFDDVLLIEDDKNVLIGTPVVAKAQVVGEVVENLKDKKVLVFKKKRRKQYRKMTGHRQMLTRVKIEKILSGLEAPEKKVPAQRKSKPDEELKKLEAEVMKKKPAAPKTEPKAADKVKLEKKAEPEKAKPQKKEQKKEKPAPVKKAAAEKPAAKKVTSKEKKATSKKEK